MRITIAKMGTVLALTSALFVGTGTGQHASAAAHTYSANGDYVHVTNGRASAHGFWDWTSAAPPTRTATVVIALQKYNPATKKWITVNTASNSTQGVGSGSGRRLPVNVPCNGSTATQWRSSIVASVNPQPGDTFNKSSTMTTISRTLACG